MRKTTLKIYAWLLGIFIPYTIWGYFTGLWLPCFYNMSTGLVCPTCGISRMFLAVFRLDIAGAFAYNPVMFILVIYWNIVGILCITEKVPLVMDRRFRYASLYVSVAAAIIYSMIRNFS